MQIRNFLPVFIKRATYSILCASIVFGVFYLSSFEYEQDGIDARNFLEERMQRINGKYVLETKHSNGKLRKHTEYRKKSNGIGYVLHGIEITWSEDGSEIMRRNWVNGVASEQEKDR